MGIESRAELHKKKEEILVHEHESDSKFRGYAINCLETGLPNSSVKSKSLDSLFNATSSF